MKKLLILVLTNFFILTLILLGRPAKAQTTEITGQFLYGLELYVLPEKQQTPDYSTAIYSRTIDEDDFITSGLYQNWLQPRLPDNINGYIYLVDSSHTIRNVSLGGGYLEQGQTLSYPFEPSIEMKHYQAQLITLFVLNPVNKILFETPSLDYIVYYEINDGTRPRIKLIDATSNENDYNRVRLTINGYDTGYNAGYSTGYENGQNNGYNNGYEDGQNNGYSAGYNAGQNDFYNDYYQQIYDDGYEDGLGDRQLGVNTVVNFNQLINNPKLENNAEYWSNFYMDIIEENNEIVIVRRENVATSSSLYQDIALTENHKYLFIYSAYLPENSLSERCFIRLLDNNNNVIIQSGISHEQNWLLSYFYNNTTNTRLRVDNYIYGSNTFEIHYKYSQFFDLTQIYGYGHEPNDINVFLNDFPSIYPYTNEMLINIDYENGYITGKNDGFAIGYDDGVSYQATQQLTSDGWIKNIFSGVGSFLAIEIIPNVTIGLIVGIPFIISVAWFVIKMARGGGND